MLKFYNLLKRIWVLKIPNYSRPVILLAALAFFCCLFAQHASAQVKGKNKFTITGIVTDTSGVAVIGANIVPVNVKGNSTATDANGKFILDVEAGTILRITYVGYQEQKVTVSADQKYLKIILNLTKSQFDDVVVTAYSRKQTRESVVGSVTTIKPGALRTPASNLTNALAGQAAGIIAFQPSGQPGLDNSNFFIRGVTTFGYKQNPLILIDNVELSTSDLARLNVDDIESFSILKDASATALYGARGGNGVILVKTKEGKAGKAQINARLENSSSQSIKTLDIADPITYMKLFNEATTTRFPLDPQPYSQNQILNTQATIAKAPGSNQYVYPAVNWLDMLFKKRTSTQRADMSISGGGGVARYYVASSYSGDNGILRTDVRNNNNNNVKFQNYQLRSNVNINVSSKTELVVRLWGNFNEYNGPLSADGGFSTDMYNYALHTSPVDFPAYYPPDDANLLTKHILFGNKASSNGSLSYINPYAQLLMGHKNFSESRMQAQLELNQNLDFLVTGLNFRGMFSTNRYSRFESLRAYSPFYYTATNYNPQTNKYVLQWLNPQPGQAQEYLGYRPGGSTLNTYLQFQGNLDYQHTFAKNHSVQATVVINREQTTNGNAATLFDALPYRNLTLAGNVAYGYKGRYYINGNFGYNGSERFSANHRYGFFPTIGGSWIISDEKFWGKLYNIFDRVKLRASYGTVGNDAISGQRFYYLSDVNMASSSDGSAGNSATFGTSGYSRPGVKINNYENDAITWETSKQLNLGLELTMLKQINLIVEVYRNNKYDILQTLGNDNIPATMGLEADVAANVGKVQSKGIDISLDGTQRISKDLSITARGNFTFATNKFLEYAQPGYKEAYRSIIGQPLYRNSGYLAERLFVDDSEAANSPTQIFSSKGPAPLGGDIKYRDLNGDGKIDAADQTYFGYPTVPEIVYGFGFTTAWKNFDLSTFFQGRARVSFTIDPSTTSPFIKSADSHFNGNTQLLQAFADNHWSEDNQNLYAMYPRLGTDGDIITNNRQSSTWWLRDGSFLRLKSVEFGYSLSKQLIKRLGVRGARIYFNGLNLITWSPFKLWDPEQGGNAFAYPVQKVYNLGLSVNL
ncbi:TonB-linked SusC/RagA family outer membrane protein [Mucilaginibacter oryzae]|uniref:TonB-linked SusC/RagA family outer membrane protein n=1 Tax=Mucilaginibacter oryzae TaxID=468058 RepID=A0A316HQD6_9SPHI|nr:TonB-dependent receptor [Mucilaginibacter oryzae]PWK77112.1 TonB-linked SusC/RagA family outer membrane protein [Mucilaginibacter oryzae]